MTTEVGSGVGKGALVGYRICDFTGQLAGAGATKWLAAFGAEVIRIEDPVLKGRWDILRAMPPFVDERRGEDFGGGFNNHNVEKRGITLNLRTEKGKELLAELVKRSDVVTENFASGVMERMGFGYERLKALKSDIIYVSKRPFQIAEKALDSAIFTFIQTVTAEAINGAYISIPAGEGR